MNSNCKYNTYGDLECPNCDKNKCPDNDSLNLVERFCGNNWVSQCQKNNAELDRLANAFQTTATEWQKVQVSSTAKPFILYNAQGEIIQ